VTKIFHPNIHWESGEVCLDILKSEWNPLWSLSKLGKAISSLLFDPNADSPLNCDAGKLSGDAREHDSCGRHGRVPVDSQDDDRGLCHSQTRIFGIDARWRHFLKLSNLNSTPLVFATLLNRNRIINKMNLRPILTRFGNAGKVGHGGLFRSFWGFGKKETIPAPPEKSEDIANSVNLSFLIKELKEKNANLPFLLPSKSPEDQNKLTVCVEMEQVFLFAFAPDEIEGYLYKPRR
jgi:hypothetical protein